MIVLTEKERVLLGFGIILLASLFSFLTTKIKQPLALGQIIVGILLGVLVHFKIWIFPFLPQDHVLEFLSELGCIFLLFEIGLESNLNEIKKSGKHALLVATTGALVPFGLGFFLVSPFISLPHDLKFCMFMGSVLAVTSTGIAVSVFKHLGIIKKRPGQIIIAASIIDDIIGLILLSITIDFIKFGHFESTILINILKNSAIFFTLSIIIGHFIIAPLIRKIRHKNIREPKDLLILTLITYCLFMAFFASYMGLASIIGAFLAGLLIEEELNLKHQVPDTNFVMPIDKIEPNQLVSLIEPIGKFLTPIFFIFAGLQIDIIAAWSYHTIKLALIITVLGVIGKAVSGIFLPKKLNKWLIGFGMVPRGEIGIIFAITGLELKVINQDIFAAILLMIVVTSLITPIILNKLHQEPHKKLSKL